MRGAQLELGVARQARDGPVRQGDRSAALGVGLDPVPGPDDGAGGGRRVVGAVVRRGGGRLVDGQRGGGVDRRLGGDVQPHDASGDDQDQQRQHDQEAAPATAFRRGFGGYGSHVAREG